MNSDQNTRPWATSWRGAEIDRALLEFLDEDDAMSVWPIIEAHCMPKPDANCSNCEGRGFIWQEGEGTCPECRGSALDEEHQR